MHSMRDKLATAIYLDSTISKDKVKQKRKKQSHSPNETDNVLFIKAPTFQRRNELLLKRAEELEELRLRNKLQTPNAPKLINIPATPDSHSRMTEKRRYTVHVKIHEDRTKKKKN